MLSAVRVGQGVAAIAPAPPRDVREPCRDDDDDDDDDGTKKELINKVRHHLAISWGPPRLILRVPCLVRLSIWRGKGRENQIPSFVISFLSSERDVTGE